MTLRGDAVAWHAVECASYVADLPLWRELAAGQAREALTARGEAEQGTTGPVPPTYAEAGATRTLRGAAGAGAAVLDLGCGTGRVALDLAATGHHVIALDADTELVDELARRARERRLRIDAIAGDARAFTLGRRFDLAIAPMQVVQLLGGSAGRSAMLERVRVHLEPGGLFAAALADPFEAVPAGEALPPLPDVLELDGWVLSSQPIAVRPERGGVAIDRVRQLVSPTGELHEELATISLDGVSPEELEDEGRASGLRPVGRRAVAETPDHVGSTVVLLEAPR